jgi:hypothetical protein
MKYELGKTYLITTSEWFYAPNGRSYKAVFGTIHDIKNDSETLGIKTNRGSTNWYVVIGDMLIAGCQVRYCIRTDSCEEGPDIRELEHEGKLIFAETSSRIYFADTI